MRSMIAKVALAGCIALLAPRVVAAQMPDQPLAFIATTPVFQDGVALRKSAVLIAWSGLRQSQLVATATIPGFEQTLLRQGIVSGSAIALTGGYGVPESLPVAATIEAVYTISTGAVRRAKTTELIQIVQQGVDGSIIIRTGREFRVGSKAWIYFGTFIVPLHPEDLAVADDGTTLVIAPTVRSLAIPTEPGTYILTLAQEEPCTPSDGAGAEWGCRKFLSHSKLLDFTPVPHE